MFSLHRLAGLSWRPKIPLTWRILAVNIFVIAMLVGSLLYLEGRRSWLIEERQGSLSQTAFMLDSALRNARDDELVNTLQRFGTINQARVRLYDRSGTLRYDNFQLGPPSYELRDPAEQGWNRAFARGLDRFIDWAVMAPDAEYYAEPVRDVAQAWPELRQASEVEGATRVRYRFAPDRTPIISAALNRGDSALLLLVNARDITRTVRAERRQLALILAAATCVSILLSLFLARTIVQPLQKLADAARRVRLGRDRGVEVPRMPERGDEIGTLARTLSDMTQAMRERIDAGERFAADVTHELKNPLASLRSAVEGLQNVQQSKSREQLLAIAADDVLRLDRLITDIAEASRVDAELSRTRFEPVDVGALIESVIAARSARTEEQRPRIVFARPRRHSAVFRGEAMRIARVIENLLDNALSFSPPDGLVRISATAVHDAVIIRVEDEGPGVRPEQRELIFHRFHSDREEGEEFGRHSGLGLAIARTIVEAHDGTIAVHDRPDGERGACFEIRLPAASP